MNPLTNQQTNEWTNQQVPYSFTNLGDGEGGVEIAQGLEFPLFPLDRDVELLDT